MEFKQGIIESYPELFTEGDSRQTNFGGVESFGLKWGWYQSVYALAAGNIERLEHITKLGAIECLTMLTFMKEKNEIEAKQIKRN